MNDLEFGAPSISQAHSPVDIAQARTLFIEYQAALGVDLCFQGFEQELAGLPGCYAPPAGRLLLASRGASTLGVVALRAAGGSDCEMKRLFVRSTARGLGLGRLLACAVINEARLAGYQRLLLDTLPTMTEAQALYRSLGFTDIAPYCDNPIAGTLYMALELGGG